MSSFPNGQKLVESLVRDLLLDGAVGSPRDLQVIEFIEPTVVTLADPASPFVTNPIRKANYRFGMAEACWIMSGSEKLDEIAKYNSRMREFSDDGRTLWGAYGPRVVSQLDHVVSSLRRDPHSRQALLTTWRPHNYLGPVTEERFPAWDGASWRSKDVPCTVAWHFQVRRCALNLTVFMRSNDVWLGTPYDILSFTTVQRVVASMLGLEVGAYHHVVSNLHLYEKHTAVANRFNDDEYGYDLSPLIPFQFEGKSVKDVSNQFKWALIDGECDDPGVMQYADVIHKRPTAIGAMVR